MKPHRLVMSKLINCVFLAISIVAHLPFCRPFLLSQSPNRQLPRPLLAASPSSNNNIDDCMVTSQQRRTILGWPLIITAETILSTAVNAADGQLPKLLDQIKEGSKQLDAIPELIKAEKWDSGK